MNDPRQRIVVDAVAFNQVFRFHRILNSITQALQPPRMIVALFVVVALTAGGNLWDSLFDERTIPSGGVLATADLFDHAEANAALRQIALTSELYMERSGDPQVNKRVDPDVLRNSLETSFQRWRETTELSDDQVVAARAELDAQIATIHYYTPMHAFEATVHMVSTQLGVIIRGVFRLSPAEVYGGFYNLLVAGPVAMWDAKPWFCIVFGLFTLLVVSIGGGALCRMATCEIAGRERLRVWDGFQFSLRHWIRLVLAPVLPLLIAAALALVLVVAGVILFWLPYVDMLGGVLYFINLFIGFLIAFLLLAYFAAFPMVLPAVATECADPADALQRAFAYLLSRPLHYLGYLIVGLIALAIGYIVVSLFAVTTLNITAAATGALPVAGANPALNIVDATPFDLAPTTASPADGFNEQIAVFFVRFWQGLVLLLVAAYVASFIFTASTHIYMLMRKLVDDQDYADIWRPGLVPGTLAPMPQPAYVPPPPATPAPPAAAEESDEAEHETERDDDDEAGAKQAADDS